MSELECGWRQIRSRALKLAHQKIREEERRLGRQLTEREFRGLLSRTLKEEFEKAFEACQVSGDEEAQEGSE